MNRIFTAIANNNDSRFFAVPARVLTVTGPVGTVAIQQPLNPFHCITPQYSSTNNDNSIENKVMDEVNVAHSVLDLSRSSEPATKRRKSKYDGLTPDERKERIKSLNNKRKQKELQAEKEDPMRSDRRREKRRQYNKKYYESKKGRRNDQLKFAAEFAIEHHDQMQEHDVRLQFNESAFPSNLLSDTEIQIMENSEYIPQPISIDVKQLVYDTVRERLGDSFMGKRVCGVCDAMVFKSEIIEQTITDQWINTIGKRKLSVIHEPSLFTF